MQIEKRVIIFIHGFLIPSKWIPFDETFLSSLNEHYQKEVGGDDKAFQYEVHVAKASPTGSLHDRCCQVFSQIKGGQVNYGKEHSDFHGHSQYGETYSGFYPQWSEENPVILIGHSFGGVTALGIQNYLENQVFGKEFNTNSRWVKAIIAIHSPWNGAIRTYTKGMHLHQIPTISVGSAGHLLGWFVHLTEFFNQTWIRKKILDFDQRSWQFSFFPLLSNDNTSKLSILTIIQRKLLSFLVLYLSVCGYGVHTNVDNIAFDCTIHGMAAWNEYLRIYDGCYYLSVVGNVLPEVEREKLNREETLFHKVLRIAMKFLHELQIQVLPQKIYGFDITGWMKEGHDGLLSVYSQHYPHFLLNLDESYNLQVVRTSSTEDVKKRVHQVSCYQQINPIDILQENDYRKNFNRQNAQPLRPGNWSSVIVPTSHLAVIWRCSLTWKVVRRAIQIIDRDTRDDCSPGNRSLTESGSQGPIPDLQLPHLYFRHHYHDRFQMNSWKDVFSQLKTCTFDNLPSFLLFLLSIVIYCAFSLPSQNVFHSRHSWYGVFGVVLFLTSLTILRHSYSDVDYTEKLSILFTNLRLAQFLPLASLSQVITETDIILMPITRSHQAVLQTVLLLTWLESLCVYAGSSCNAQSRYSLPHNSVNNHRYHYLSWLRSFCTVSFVLVTQGELFQSERSSILQIWCTFEILTMLPALLWQLSFNQSAIFSNSAIIKIDPLQPRKPTHLPLSTPQAAMIITAIMSHMVFHTGYGYSLYLLYQLDHWNNRFQIIWMILLQILLFYYYQELSMNLQFVLIKLQFWKKFFSKYFLQEDGKKEN